MFAKKMSIVFVSSTSIWKSITKVTPSRQVGNSISTACQPGCMPSIAQISEISRSVHHRQICTRSNFQWNSPINNMTRKNHAIAILPPALQQIRSASNSTATANGDNKAGENKIKSILEKAFPAASKLIVEDISGGCGSMYQIYLESMEFTGLSIVKQHQLVNKALKEEIKIMHGIRIETQVPKN